MAEAIEKTLWERRKVQIVLIGIVAVIALVISGSFLSIPWEQVEKGIEAIELLVGLLLGGHVGTDVAAMIRSAILAVRSPAPDGPPAGDDEDDEDDDEDDIERGPE